MLTPHTFKIQFFLIYILFNLRIITQKKPDSIKNQALTKNGDDLLSHISAVSSALVSLTSLFGMGRGGTSLL